MSEDTDSRASASTFLGVMVFLSVVYIVYSSLAALVLKYIFLDYFARIGWATNFSYVTVVMMLLTTKFVVSFSTASVKNSFKSQKD
jgi:hypothetical protein